MRHKQKNRRIALETGSQRVWDLTGQTPLGTLLAILQDAKLMVSSDSGPAHMAAAVGCPTVSLFGRKKEGLGPARWAPVGNQSRFLQKDPGCALCLADECPISFECLHLLRPSEVRDAVQSLLAEQVSRAFS